MLWDVTLILQHPKQAAEIGKVRGGRGTEESAAV